MPLDLQQDSLEHALAWLEYLSFTSLENSAAQHSHVPMAPPTFIYATDTADTSPTYTI